MQCVYCSGPSRQFTDINAGTKNSQVKLSVTLYNHLICYLFLPYPQMEKPQCCFQPCCILLCVPSFLGYNHHFSFVSCLLQLWLLQLLPHGFVRADASYLFKRRQCTLPVCLWPLNPYAYSNRFAEALFQPYYIPPENMLCNRIKKKKKSTKLFLAGNKECY